ncbi:hypothetical protein BZG05_01565 [Salinivibrio kushneri]|uniref:hypothetical protein n=1 Tax=Salinivibrio kushneri TaxID=1908198 RepID=UPI000989517F|nr:hypothetical protein [Salinivibrio kushneri]OOE36197.1 hypothetical protein BZG05_01565 [Salinivibrio kushneri]
MTSLTKHAVDHAELADKALCQLESLTIVLSTAHFEDVDNQHCKGVVWALQELATTAKRHLQASRDDIPPRRR